MTDDLIKKLSNLFDDNLIPYMEILKNNDTSNNSNIDATIKVYFPKIMLNICKFLDKKFILNNKKSILIKKDFEGYSYVDVSFFVENNIITIRIYSILQNTWGIANEF